MIREEHFFLTSEHDGLRLGAVLAAPEGEIRGLVQLVHGMAEHKGRYLPVMRALAERGYACVIHDHRGHGESVRSAEDLGHFYRDGATGAVNDTHQLTIWLRERYPGKKLVLFGHSMGSLIVRAYAAKYGEGIDGLIVCGSPGYNSAAPAGLALVRVLSALRGDHARSRFVYNLLNGAFSSRFPGEPESAWISANPENRAAFEADPICGFAFTLNGYAALLQLMLEAYNRKKPIRAELPVHFMSGAEDSCAPDAKGFEAAVQNFRDRGCRDVTAKIYPGLRHEILNEGVAEVWEDLADVVGRMIG